MVDYASTLGELHDYLNHLSGNNHTVFTTEQEKIEFEKAKQGDLSAKGELIRSNIGLLQNILQKFDYQAAKAGISLCDLASDILVGIVSKRFDSYNPEFNTRIGGYLFDEKITKQEIRKKLYSYSAHGMPCSPMNRNTSFLPLPSEGNDEMDETSISPEERMSYRLIAKQLKDLPTGADYVMHQEDYETTQKLIDTLPTREQQVIKGVYLENLPSKQIGILLNISGTRVRQIRDETLNTLKIKFKKDIKLDKKKKAI